MPLGSSGVEKLNYERWFKSTCVCIALVVVAVLIPGGCSFQMELVPETSLKVHGHLSLLHLLSGHLRKGG